MNDFDVIRATVSIEYFCNHYGLQINKHKKIACPFHDDKTPSLQIYSETKSFYCFGCGCGGDVITFAQKYYGLKDRYEASKRISDDFGLGLFKSKKGYWDRILAGKAAFERNQDKIINNAPKIKVATEDEVEEKEAEDSAEKEYWEIFDIWKRLDKIVERRRPKSPEDTTDLIFMGALVLLSQYENELEYAEIKRRRFSK